MNHASHLAGLEWLADNTDLAPHHQASRAWLNNQVWLAQNMPWFIEEDAETKMFGVPVPAEVA